MLAQKLLISGIGIVGIASSIAILNPDLFKSASLQSTTTQTVAKVLIEDNGKNIPTSGILNDRNAEYVCKANNKKIENCQIYKLNTKNQNILLSAKSEITNNLTVVISYPESEKEKIKDQTKISIYSNNDTKYFDLIISNDLFNNQRGIKSKTIVAKIKEISKTVSESIHKTPYKLNIGQNKNCKIYKVSGNLDLSNTTIPFSSNSLSIEKQVTQKSDLSTDQHVIIETEEENIFLKDWIDSSKEIFLNDGTTKFLTIEKVLPVLGLNTEIAGMADAKENDNAYLIVSSEAVTGQTTSPTAGDFYKDNQKGYKCLVPIAENQNDIDPSCQLYKLNSNTTEDLTIVDLHSITTYKSNSIVTTNPSATKKFVLKISRNLLNRMQKTDTSKISLVDNTAEEKKYINLSKEYEINKDSKGFKTNIILAKINDKAANSPTLIQETIDFKCKTKPSSTLSECKVLGFSTGPTESNALVTINKSHLAKLSNSNAAQYANGKYVLIQLNESFKTEKELRSYAPEIYITNNENNYLLKTEYVDAYTGSFNALTPANSNLFKIKKSPQDYLVVVSSPLNSSNAPSSELTTNSTKNYKCKLSSPAITDVSCSLIKITSDSSKGINLTAALNANSPATAKSDFTAGAYFKLIINDHQFMSQKFTDSMTISVESNKNDASNNNKSYATLKVVSKFLIDRTEAETQWFLAKATVATTALNSATSFKCKFADEQTSAACDVYGKSTSLSETQDKSWNLSGFTKETSSSSNLAQNKYAIIKLATAKSINNFSGKTIKLTKDNDANEVNFNVEAPLHVITDTSSAAITGKPLILA